MQRINASGTFYYGYCIDMLNEIQKIDRFEYEIYVTPDGKYGDMDKNMVWNGMIRELIDKVKDCQIIRFFSFKVDE